MATVPLPGLEQVQSPAPQVESDRTGPYLSQTQFLVSQIRRVIHEVRDMNKYIGNNKKQQSNNLSKQEDLPHMHSPSPHNDERNGGDCKYSANSMYEPQSQGEHGKLYNPRYHGQILPLSLPKPAPRTPEPGTSHTYPDTSSRSASDSSSLVDSCLSDNTSDSSSSC